MDIFEATKMENFSDLNWFPLLSSVEKSQSPSVQCILGMAMIH